MNIRQVTLISSVALISVLATYVSINFSLSSVAPTDPKEKKEVFIKFKVNGDATKLEVTDTNPPGCKVDKGEKAGCFKVKGKKTGLIKYVYTPSDNWTLSEFMICQRKTEITVAEPCTTPLTLNERLEFSVMEEKTGGKILVTPASGVVDLTPLSLVPGSDGDVVFYLFDQNTINLNYVYSITACDGPKDTIGTTCIRLDPPVENKGRK